VRRHGPSLSDRHRMPFALDNGERSPRKLLRAVIARLLGRKPYARNSSFDRCGPGHRR